MNNVVRYKNEIDDVLKKVKNNIDYFDSFGEVYIPVTLKNHLEIIYEEMAKVKEVVTEKENNFD